MIPVRNDAQRLRRCLRTIQANTYPSRQVEVIVVDNGSHDGSADVAREAGARVVVLPGLPVAELRNRGAGQSTGEILAFVDADHEIVADWIVSAVDTFSRDRRVGAVGAPYEAPSDGTWVQRTYDLLRRRPPGVRDVEWLGSGNLAVRREAFEAIGGFDTRLQTCEDVDLCRRLRAHGSRVIHDSRLRTVHLGDPATLGELFRAELWRGRNNLHASLRGRVSLREMPSIALPVADLCFLLAVVAAAAIPSPAGPAIALAALSGLLAGAGARATRMLLHRQRLTPLRCGQAMAVALTYDVARALAVVSRVGHETRRTRA